MTATWFLTEGAEATLAEIYNYTSIKWGDNQAERYVKGIFQRFDAIVTRRISWRLIAPEYHVEGFFNRYERHYIFWRQFDDGQIGFAAVLHDAMLQSERLVAAFCELPAN